MSLSNLKGKGERARRREKGDWKAEMLPRASGMAAERGRVRGGRIGIGRWGGV